MGAALAGTIAAVEAAGGTGRFNFLLTDGQSVAATACGDTLWYRLTGEGTHAPPPPWSRRSRATTSPAGPRFPTGTC